MYDLQRFKTAQERDHLKALVEIQEGRKQSHWIWYVFPQLKDLGHSHNAKYYGIADINEAVAYFSDPLLRSRLIEISTTLLQHKGKSAREIMGKPDDTKLRSCMTLFGALPDAHPVFDKVIDDFFHGEKDQRTLSLL